MQFLAGFPLQQPGFEPKSGQVEFVVNKVARGQISFKYFSFICQFSFHQLLHHHYHLSSRAGTMCQRVINMLTACQLFIQLIV
jgi:hypothetical protein